MKFLLNLLLGFLLLNQHVRAISVTFRVDMGQETVHPSGVHIAGDFQTAIGLPANWNPSATSLNLLAGTQIYELTVNLPTGGYSYKYLNGITWPTAEVNLNACGTGNDFNRVLVVGLTDTILPVAIFNRCLPPGNSFATHWWNDAIFYEVFVRSFYDSNGDGRGDFAGLTAKLDYLNDGNPNTTTDLGITAIWLMPIMPSPSYHGYDITNFKAIKGDYGTMAQFDAFLAAAHQRGIKVIIDLVLNHTSNQHPWFTQSASGSASPYRDWYIWSPTNPGYSGPWGQSVWAPNNGNFFYSLFWSGMPDLNWRKPEVKTAIWDAVQFWLDKGVDGYRLDAVKYLVEDSLFSPAQVKFENTAGTFSALQEFGNVVRTANPNAFTIGEAWSATPNVVPYSTGNRLDACFEFDLALATVNAVKNETPAGLRSSLIGVDQSYTKLQYGTFLSNHDQERVFSTLAGNLPKMKQAAAIYLTLPGVPFLYYGEEIGMLGTGVDEDKRKPMQWTASTHAGFSTATPWRPINSNYALFNVETAQADPNSLLNHYKKLIAMRNSHEALRKGYLLPATSSSNKVLSYGRIHNGEAFLVVSNLGSAQVNNCQVSAGVSTLPAGTWTATNLLTGTDVGTLTTLDNGSFANWLVDSLKGNETRIFRLNQTTKVWNELDNMGINLFPNPAQSVLNLEIYEAISGGQIRVFDLTGKDLLKFPFIGSRFQMDTKSWTSGSYFLEICTEKGKMVKRVVIER